MKIKVYVNWNEEKLLNAKEYEKEILKCAKEREADDDYEFADFLNDYLDGGESSYRYKLAYLFNIDDYHNK